MDEGEMKEGSWTEEGSVDRNQRRSTAGGSVLDFSKFSKFLFDFIISGHAKQSIKVEIQ